MLFVYLQNILTNIISTAVKILRMGTPSYIKQAWIMWQNDTVLKYLKTNGNGGFGLKKILVPSYRRMYKN